jgi:RNA polymerase sigma factor (sigma-70 family)
MAAIAKVPGAQGDDELARAAVAGNGHAFAELYDRHERRVYGFCLRLLGNPADAADATQETFMRLLKRLPALEHRELNFLAYVFTTARHACYDIVQARKRVELSGEEIEASGLEPGAIEEDPERAALLGATRELTEQAHARLPERQREVLALRELEGLSYEEIAEVMELKPNAVAQLISRARIKLAELVRSDALASVASASPDCDRALPLLACEQDRQKLAGEESNWLLAHLRDCAVCQVRESAMQEAGVSYRSLAPIVPLLWLRQATIARAAEFVGADWSEFAHARVGQGGGGGAANGVGRGGDGGPGAGRGGHAARGRQSDGTRSGAGGNDGGGRAGATATETGAVGLSLRGAGLGERLGLDALRRRAGLVLLAACLLALLLFVGSIARDGAVPTTRTLTPASAGASTSLPYAVRKPARKRVVVHREKTVRRVLPSGRVVSVKVPVTSTILLPVATHNVSGGTKTVHRNAHRPPDRSTPSASQTSPSTTTTPTTTTTTQTPTQTTPPTTSTPTPIPITPTTTTPTTTTPTQTTPTTTNPNPPTETNPNAPPGALNPNTPGR